MAGILPLGVVTIETDSTYESGSEIIYTSDGDILASVIVTNTTNTDGEAYVFINTTSFPTSPQIAYKLPIPAYNTYETFRFALDPGDELSVAGSAGLVFYAQGIAQA